MSQKAAKIKIFKRLIPKPFYSIINRFFIKPFIKEFRQSYAQCGEDLILNLILNKERGFYIDIGANNPVVQSNTMFFYKKGWRGINIDATPGSMTGFNKIRKRDINLEIAVSGESKEIALYLFESSFYNTSDENFASKHKNILIDKILIKASSLENILDRYLDNAEIDFMSIDVEGNDYDVLISNNWLKYRPSVIVVEYITYCKSNLENNKKTKKFLEDVGYSLFCSSVTNAFFLENHFYQERFGDLQNEKL